MVAIQCLKLEAFWWEGQEAGSNLSQVLSPFPRAGFIRANLQPELPHSLCRHTRTSVRSGLPCAHLNSLVTVKTSPFHLPHCAERTFLFFYKGEVPFGDTDNCLSV